MYSTLNTKIHYCQANRTLNKDQRALHKYPNAIWEDSCLWGEIKKWLKTKKKHSDLRNYVCNLKTLINCYYSNSSRTSNSNYLNEANIEIGMYNCIHIYICIIYCIYNILYIYNCIYDRLCIMHILKSNHKVIHYEVLWNICPNMLAFKKCLVEVSIDLLTVWK